MGYAKQLPIVNKYAAARARLVDRLTIQVKQIEASKQVAYTLDLTSKRINQTPSLTIIRYLFIYLGGFPATE